MTKHGKPLTRRVKDWQKNHDKKGERQRKQSSRHISKKTRTNLQIEEFQRRNLIDERKCYVIQSHKGELNHWNNNWYNKSPNFNSLSSLKSIKFVYRFMSLFMPILSIVLGRDCDRDISDFISRKSPQPSNNILGSDMLDHWEFFKL